MMLKALFAGFFIFNSVPHLVKGITGQTHMTPFKRKSSPMLNIIWAFSNLVIGVLVLGFDSYGMVNLPKGDDFWAFIIGGFLLALIAAWLFGKKNARFPWHKD